MNRSRKGRGSQQVELLWFFLASIGLLLLAWLPDGRLLDWAAANEVAAVRRDGVPLRAEMSASSRVLATLKYGQAVTVSFATTTADGNWCLIVEDPGGREGYVECGDLEREPPAQWRQAPPAPARPLPTPGAEASREVSAADQALLKAAGSGETATAQALLGQGVSQAAKDAALRTAALRGHADTVRVLLASRVQVDSRDINDQTPLYLAANGGHDGVVLALAAAGADVNARNRWGGTPLMAAALWGRLETVQALLSRGADAKAQDARGQTALSIAASHAGRATIPGKKSGHVPTIQALLANGAEVNARDEAGRTALMLAAANGHLGAVEALLAGGADVSVKDKYAGTALREASEGRHVSVVRLLKQAGARE